MKANRALPASRVGLPYAVLALWLWACQAPRVQPICETAVDCDSGESCNSAGQCARGSLVMDDFEDADNLPTSELFAEWLHYSYNPSLQPVNHFIQGPGHNSNYGLLLDWVVPDEPDGDVNGTGAGVVSRAANDYVDLSGYTRLVLSHLFQGTAAGDCISTPRFRVGFGCREYGAAFEATVETGPDWTTANLVFATFYEPGFLQPTGVPIEECLAFTDGLNFATADPLEDGQCAAGLLWLDSIAFR